MTDRDSEIFEEVMEACDAILAAIQGRSIAASGSGLLVALIVIAHDDAREKDGLIRYVVSMIHESWPIFTRERVEKSIAGLRKKRTN